jgi:3D (Asp-Asp-Asp) domain-containing protein
MIWSTAEKILTGIKMKPYILYIIATPLFLFRAHFAVTDTDVLGITDIRANAETFSEHDIEINTTSSFQQEEIIETESLPFEIVYKDDDETEYGQEAVLQEGEEGRKEYKYLVTYWFDEEIYRNLVDTQVYEPKDEIIAKGTKIVWRPVNTDQGTFNYWYKLRVWATKYDGNCDGCRGLTYSGTPVRKGVCAVDPKVIPLGTNFYVVGYGMCRSEDIGGAIKGNRIDLGYEDVMKGSWRTGWTDVYLLTNSPEGDGDFYDR